ncbi:hypothetical protein V493_07633 [Pseudogymnoascus sp. VKM F-4281 (FW-2241)]|nr:hypothetical protein V493_07633 [Pseudogymnoascus sp. VKM F-4281 (FW-2241)]
MAEDTPELPLPDRGATLVMRVMPDDNSCLFRAFAAAVLPGDDLSMLELRSLVASQIQEEPDVYTKVVLDNRDPDDYCRWIQTEEAWGGAIELAILSKHFKIEVCSIDVQTASTKAPPSAASSSTPASTTTPSFSLPPTHRTPSPTTRPS